MNRREFSKATKLKAWERTQGRCEDCGCKIIAGQVEYDHVIEAYLGGGNTVSNCRVLCARCHVSKTAQRRPEVDKTRRLVEKQANVRSKRPMPGSRRSKWKRKMDGTVVER